MVTSFDLIVQFLHNTPASAILEILTESQKFKSR